MEWLIFCLIGMICITIIVFAINKTPIFKKEINLFVEEGTALKTKVVNYPNLLIICVLVAVVVLITANTYFFSKQDIEAMTLEDFKNIDGIGPEKAEIIYNYIKNNEIKSINDLILLDGIGETTVNKLKKLTK